MFRIMTTEGGKATVAYETALAAIAINKAVRMSQAGEDSVRVERNAVLFCTAKAGSLYDHANEETTLEKLLAKLSQPGVER
jgi:hypothetical protein